MNEIMNDRSLDLNQWEKEEVWNTILEKAQKISGEQSL
jgi:hypothetical protein